MDFLNPHSQYKGVKFFFPSTKEDLKNSNYELRRLPPNGDDPKHLLNSFLRFLVKVAFLNLKNDSETAYSMLIHTAGRKRDHLEDRKKIQDFISTIINELKPKADRYYKYMENYGIDLNRRSDNKNLQVFLS